MQNMLQLQDDLKNFSEQQLVREMQMPSGQVPQFLILTELGRRKRMRDDFSRQQAAGAPTVAEEAVAAAGMPVGASTDMAKAMAPKTSMTENTGIGTMMPKQPTRMAEGGDVKPRNRFEMLMAYLRNLREKEEEPTPTSTGPSIAEMINFGGDYEPVKKAEGGVVKMQTGGLPEREVLQRIINTLTTASPSERAALRQQLVEAVGEDTVREAEAMMLRDNESPGGITQMRMEKQGIFGNSPGRPQLTPEKPTFLPPPESTRQRGDLETGQLTSILASDPITKALAQKSGVSVADYISGMDPNTRAQELLRVSGQRATTFDKDKDDAAKAEATVPTIYDTSIGMPTQADLDLKNVSDTRNEAVGIGTSDNPISVDLTQDVAPTASSSAGLPARPTSPTAPTPDISMSPDNLNAIGGLETIQSAPEAFTMETAAANLASMVGPDDAIEQVRASQLTNADRFDTLGFTPITTEDGSKRFITPSGMVYDSDGKLISGGEAMQAVDIAQQQGADFTKTPEGLTMPPLPIIGPLIKNIPLPNEIPFGTNEVDAEGNVIPGTFRPTSIPIGNVSTPSVIEDNVAKPLIDLFNIEEGSAPVTSVDESETRVSPATPAEDVVGETPAKLPVTTSGIEDFVEQEKFRTFDKPTVSNEDGDGDGDTPKPDPDLPGGPSGTGGIEGGLAEYLKDMKEDLEKSKKQDYWMNVAKMGLALMASKQPTLGGAIGEAGMKGVEGFQKGKQQYSKDKLAILALQQRIDAAKLAASSRASASNAALARLGLSIDKENRLANQAVIDNALDRLNALGGVDRIRVLQNADDLSPTEAQELVMLKGLYDTVFGGNTGAKAVNVAG